MEKDMKMYKREVNPLRIKEVWSVAELNRLADEGWIFMKAWKQGGKLIYQMKKQ